MTKPRLVPMAQIDTTPKPVLISVADAAAMWDMDPQTMRNWIAKDMEDGRGRVPGGRKEGGRYVIIRAVFERANYRGIEPVKGPEYPALDIPAAISQLRRIAHESNALADALSVAVSESRAA